MGQRTVVVVDPVLADAVAAVAVQYPTLHLLAAREPDELPRLVGEAEVLIVQEAAADASLLQAAPHLKLLLKMGRVYDNVDAEVPRARRIPLGLVPRKGPNCVAEHAMTLILALSKSLVLAHRGVVEGAYRWRGMRPILTSERVMAFRWIHPVNLHEVRGKALGCVGFGEIGCELSCRAQAMGMRVRYSRRRRLPAELEEAYQVEYRPLDDLFSESDYVCIAVPHTPDTHHLVTRDRLARLGQRGYLVNVARGGVVDEEALIEALREGAIAGAGLDVFTYEPLPADSPLCRLDNVILTPHIGGGSGTTRSLELSEALEEVQRVLAGEAPRHPVAA